MTIDVDRPRRANAEGATDLFDPNLKFSPEPVPSAGAPRGTFVAVCDQQTQDVCDAIRIRLKKQGALHGEGSGAVNSSHWNPAFTRPLVHGLPSCRWIRYHGDMTRTRIQWIAGQTRATEFRVPSEERSVTGLARRCAPDIRPFDRRVYGIAGRFYSGCPMLAEEHDCYLDDAFGS